MQNRSPYQNPKPIVVTDNDVILKTADGTEYQIVDGALMKRLPFASGWIPADNAQVHSAPKKSVTGIRAQNAILAHVRYAIAQEMPMAVVNCVGVSNNKYVHRIHNGFDDTHVYIRTTVDILEGDELNKELF